MMTMQTPETRFPSSLKSPLIGVSLAAWQRFAAALEVQPMSKVSARGGFGSYDLKPRRLADLGMVTGVLRVGPIDTCRFASPWTQESFLADPRAQLDALGRSMRLYQDEIRGGKIQQPKGMSLAGTLALLHCGPGALSAFPDLFPPTRTLYERAHGAF